MLLFQAILLLRRREPPSPERPRRGAINIKPKRGTSTYTSYCFFIFFVYSTVAILSTLEPVAVAPRALVFVMHDEASGARGNLHINALKIPRKAVVALRLQWAFSSVLSSHQV